eukprot:CAMPEP_0181471872 /NCGR_PEP_ID=MMETSP1110-20121109/39301_1 /TAXON_ID=174948 /ORGANISM="Symbiodinium sp., Strain CCMP421" /LENGTH=266 /DNA_ID=CAMNT_0023596909 /DNA_START=30 /DNA_END=827 /DNA_ORIENTATION=+
MAQTCHLRMLTFMCLIGFRLVAAGSGNVQGQAKVSEQPRRELIRKEHRTVAIQSLKAAPVSFSQYKFTVSKTREGETSSIISEFFLSDQKGEELSLKDASVVAAFTVAQATVDDPVNLIDNDASTSSSLAFNQPVVVRVNPGHSVGGFGFKTTADEAKIGNDPTSFKLEGSMDGSTWYLLNVKTDYDTPKKRGALVGPFVVSQLTAMALGNHTLPAEAMPDKDSKPFEPAARAGTRAGTRACAGRGRGIRGEHARGHAVYSTGDAR